MPLARARQRGRTVRAGQPGMRASRPPGHPAGQSRESGRSGDMHHNGELGGATTLPDMDDQAGQVAATGQQLWETQLRANANANPMSYRGRSGKQYVAINAGGTIVSYSLSR